MIGWQECPSVTPGGKPSFFYNKEKRLSVVWSRNLGGWIVQDKDGVMVSGPFKSSCKALEAAIK